MWKEGDKNMDIQVAHIYGASGSGTSTIGKFISNKLAYFFMDTDNYFCESTNPPYTMKRNICTKTTKYLWIGQLLMIVVVWI